MCNMWEFMVFNNKSCLDIFRWLDSAVGDGKIERTLKAVGKCLVLTILLFVMLKKRILYKKN